MAHPYQQQYPYQSMTQQYPYMSPQQRLQTLEQQYPQYGQSMQTMAQQPVQAPPQQSQSNAIMSVTSEQQAREYPLDLSGAPMIFVMQDESKIFAKRFNVSNALPEFEVYEKASKTAPQVSAVPAQDNSVLLGIVGDFSNKLETMYAEIQALRKDVQNGNQLGSDSKSAGKQKSADATGNANGAGNGSGGK